MTYQQIVIYWLL